MAAVIVCMIQRVLLYRIYFMHYNNLTIVQRSSLWIVTQANCSLMLTFKLHRNITLNNKMCIVTIRVTASVVSNLWIWPQTRFSFIVPGHFSKKKKKHNTFPLTGYCTTDQDWQTGDDLRQMLQFSLCDICLSATEQLRKFNVSSVLLRCPKNTLAHVNKSYSIRTATLVCTNSQKSILPTIK